MSSPRCQGPCCGGSGPEAKMRRIEPNESDDRDVVIIHESALDNLLPPEFKLEWQRRTGLDGTLKFEVFMKQMLSTGTLSDVTFLLKGKDDEEKRVKGHKCVLKRKSEFFAALFNGGRWEQQDEVNLMGTGFSAEDFKIFLEYLYTDEANITTDNVIGLYYIANVYLPGKSDFGKKCEVVLAAKNVDKENVFKLFNAVYFHNDGMGSMILTNIIHFICSTGESMLDRIELKQMALAAVSTIFSQEKFNSQPGKLLRFCLGWIKYHHGREAIENFENVDTRIKDELKVTLHNGGKRFPKLSEMFRADMIKPPPDPNQVYKFTRFASVKPNSWVYRRNRTDRISFRVTEPIILTALGFYGDFYWKSEPLLGTTAPDPGKYSLDVSIYVHGSPHREFLSIFRRAGSEMRSDKTFKVDVEPCFIHSDTWYTIAVKITGPSSYCGNGGYDIRIAKCGKLPLVIEFKEASTKDPNAKLSNPTGVPVGQIPDIYFKLANGGKDDDVVPL